MRSFPRLSVMTLSSAFFLTTAPVWAGPVYENSSGGSFTFYGQFSPAYADFDDGSDSKGEGADNAKSNSRVGFTLAQPFGDYELGFKFETALGLRQTSSISQLYTPDGLHWDRQKLRHVDFSLKTPGYGTFYLGQGSMASDNIGDRSYSGATLAGDIAIGDVVGGYLLRRSDGVLSDVTVADAFANFDGGRLGRVRYDSPDFNGFTLRAAYGRNILDSDNGDDYWDVAMAYENDLASGTKLTAGVGYMYRDREDPNAEDIKDTFVSGSVLLTSGFNFTLAAGDRNGAGAYYYGSAGYNADWVSWGGTAVTIDYYNGDDMVTEGDSAESWGVQMVQAVDRYDIDLYAGYRRYDYDDNVSDFQNASSYMVGARWKF